MRFVRLKSLPERAPRAHGFFALARREVAVTVRAAAAARRPMRVRLRYRVAGPVDGVPALFVHGIAASGYSWRHVFAPLAEAGYRVYLLDSPGAGASDAPPGFDYAPAKVGRTLLGFARALGLTGAARAHLVGNSLGGLYSLEAYVRAPDAWRSLTLVHAAGFPTVGLGLARAALAVPPVRALLAWALRRFAPAILASVVPYADPAWLTAEEIREYAAPLGDRRRVAALLAQLWQSLAPSGFARLHARLRAWRARGGRLDPAPTLIYAERDPVVPPGFGRRWQALLPGSELVVLPRTFHTPQCEVPDAYVAAQLQAWRRASPGERGAPAGC